MIVLTTISERNPRTGKIETVVNRAFDLDTGQTVVVPCETPQALGARRHPDHGWVLDA